ncbi:MAG: hypothetical protein OXF41_00720 [bacterium]|nr:hypothetical protein [bacterium]
MTNIRTIISVALLLAMAAGTGLLLLRIGGEVWIPTPGEILDAPPEQAVYGCIWLIAVSIFAWLALSIALSVCAHVVRIPAAIRAVEWATVGPVRRLARRLAALILAMGSISASYPAGAAQVPPVPIVVSEEQELVVDPRTAPIPGVSIPVSAGMISDTLTGPARTTGSDERIGVSTPAALRASGEKASTTGEYIEYVVQPGDSMWSVSSVHVHGSKAGPLPDHEVAGVWRWVVELNRGRLRSGDPDLIFPGEILVLPVLPLHDGP